MGSFVHPAKNGMGAFVHGIFCPAPFSLATCHCDLGKLVSFKLYGIGHGIGHALSKSELDATPKSCMRQSFSVGYTVNHDTSFMLYTIKLHRVTQPLAIF